MHAIENSQIKGLIKSVHDKDATQTWKDNKKKEADSCNIATASMRTKATIWITAISDKSHEL